MLSNDQRKIPQKKAIFNRRDITEKLESIAENTPLDHRRSKLFTLLNEAYKAGWLEVKRRHRACRSISEAALTPVANCYLMDMILKTLLDFTATHIYPNPNPTESEHITLIATGGYGRGEMAPYSDVDLTFLIPYKVTPWVENVVEFILYFLWDMGLKVGHATRNPDEIVRMAKEDLTICTSLLESRMIWGSATAFKQARKLFVSKVIKGNESWFINGKLEERDSRHKKLGDSRYVVEPNLKEGKGGLRDLQTTWWIARFTYIAKSAEELMEEGVFSRHELQQFKRVEQFLWSVRCSLHYMTDRAEERLSFDMQRQLSQFMKYQDKAGSLAVERFMKHYFLIAKTVGDLTRILCAALEQGNQKKSLLDRIRPARKVGGFKSEQGRLKLMDKDDFKTNPIFMLKIFHIADKHNYDIHPETLRQLSKDLALIDDTLREDSEANKLFLDILTSKNNNELALKRLNEAGVFGKFIPDFGRVVAQMQYDMYHHYTVDEHTIRALGLLSKVEKGDLDQEHPVSSKVVHHISSRKVLYTAVLLHDVAKGRKGDHSILGAEVAEELCPKMGFTPGETKTISWLVRQHLLMSETAFKRDLSDPKTIQDFCDEVKSMERLRLLMLLTVVDIKAVGPGVWNGWKGQLLRNLYFSSEEKLLAGHVRFGRAERVQERQTELKEKLSLKKTPASKLFGRLYDSYWLAEELEIQAMNMELIQTTDKLGEILGVAARVDEFQAMTHVTVYAQDHPGLFARIVGALGVAGATIAGAKIHTTRDGMALDNFLIQDADRQAYNDPIKLEKLERTIHETLLGKVKITERLKKRKIIGDKSAHFHINPVVSIDNNASSKSTVIEVSAKDRQGLLHDLSFVLYRLKLSLISAHVATWGEHAVDTFYVSDLTGGKITNKVRLRNIEQKLLLASEGKSPWGEALDK
ncbi:[protein-PII] uridylyltransferase [Temperatibacter marinus]|uniref:Bifunctional uridylyltransferase/uridylyl-removing enzyme n=1 Tax=Temperatibacter marinus TaxID=1456591 RepID=A0AA52HBK5_9PROT|nr:[protein-PII] uridylyltransferase [Temperatibacter marinus]WND03743.1 [protein-PII] uridylyltransferase [Temperatibacter marinus]